MDNPTPIVISTPSPKRKFWSGKTFFLLVGLVFLLAGLGFGTFLVSRQQSQNITSKAAGALAASDCQVAPGQTSCQTTVSWNFDAGHGDNYQINAGVYDQAAGERHLDEVNLQNFWHAPIEKDDPNGCYSDCNCSSGNCGGKCGYPGCKPHQDGSKSFTLECGKKYRFTLYNMDWWCGNGQKPVTCCYPTPQDSRGLGICPSIGVGNACGTCQNSNVASALPGLGVDSTGFVQAQGCQTTSPLKCTGVTIFPNSLSVLHGSETRSLTATSSGGTAPITFSWTTTGGVLSATTGNPVTWTAPADIIGSSQSWTITAKATDANGHTDSSGCVVTLNPTLAACQKVSSDPTDLSKVKVGDTITFTGYGVTNNETEIIDKINFVVLKNGTQADNTEEVATRDPNHDKEFGGKAWKGTKAFKVTEAGSYSVRIRVHWKNQDIWKE